MSSVFINQSISRNPSITVPSGRVAARPVAADKAAVKAKQKAKDVILAKAVIFAALTLFSYCFSSLVGHAFAESARQNTLQMNQVLSTLKRSEKEMVMGIQSEASPLELNAWAAEHGFVSGEEAEAASQPSSLD